MSIYKLAYVCLFINFSQIVNSILMIFQICLLLFYPPSSIFISLINQTSPFFLFSLIKLPAFFCPPLLLSVMSYLSNGLFIFSRVAFIWLFCAYFLIVAIIYLFIFSVGFQVLQDICTCRFVERNIRLKVVFLHMCLLNRIFLVPSVCLNISQCMYPSGKMHLGCFHFQLW